MNDQTDKWRNLIDSTDGNKKCFPDELTGTLSEACNLIDQLEAKFSKLNFMYDGAKIEIEKLEARLKAAEELCEAVEGGRNANSRKELRAWEQDIEDALKAWPVMREKK